MHTDRYGEEEEGEQKHAGDVAGPFLCTPLSVSFGTAYMRRRTHVI